MTDIPAADVQATTSDDVYEAAEAAYWQVIYSEPFGRLESGVAVETARAARRAAVDAAQAHGATVERARTKPLLDALIALYHTIDKARTVNLGDQVGPYIGLHVDDDNKIGDACVGIEQLLVNDAIERGELG